MEVLQRRAVAPFVVVAPCLGRLLAYLVADHPSAADHPWVVAYFQEVDREHLHSCTSYGELLVERVKLLGLQQAAPPRTWPGIRASDRSLMYLEGLAVERGRAAVLSGAGWLPPGAEDLEAAASCCSTSYNGSGAAGQQALE